MAREIYNDPISTYYSVVGNNNTVRSNPGGGHGRPLGAVNADEIRSRVGRDGVTVLQTLAEKNGPYPVERLGRDIDFGPIRLVDTLRQLESYGLVRLRHTPEDAAELRPHLHEFIRTELT